MIDAAIKALSQLFSPHFRTILFKSAGLAAVLLIVALIGLFRLAVWLTDKGSQWIQTTADSILYEPIQIFSWLLTIAIGIGLFTGAVLLMPAVTALVASFFSDDIAVIVEKEHYPFEPLGSAVPLPRAIWEGVKTTLFALLIYLFCVPFLLFAGAGVVMFFLATAYVLGREYFELAAMRFHSPERVKELWRANRMTIFIAGMFIAGFVSIPLVNLATPLFGMALMVHMHKRITDKKVEIFEPGQGP